MVLAGIESGNLRFDECHVEDQEVFAPVDFVDDEELVNGIVFCPVEDVFVGFKAVLLVAMERLLRDHPVFRHGFQLLCDVDYLSGTRLSIRRLADAVALPTRTLDT